MHRIDARIGPTESTIKSKKSMFQWRLFFDKLKNDIHRGGRRGVVGISSPWRADYAVGRFCQLNTLILDIDRPLLPETWFAYTALKTTISPRIYIGSMRKLDQSNLRLKIKKCCSNDDFFNKPKNDISPWWSARCGGSRLIVESGPRCGPLLPIKHANT